MSHTELDVLRRAIHDFLSHPLATVQVHPDGLPRTCPAPLPHPQEFTLVGSVEANVLPHPGRGSASVFFETLLAVQEAQLLLGQALLPLGWEGHHHAFTPPRGFGQEWEEPGPAAQGLPHFFLHHETRFVAVLRGRREEGRTLFTLRLEGGHAYAHYVQRGDEPFLLLPLLLAPPGITVQLLDNSAGRSGEVSHAHTAALLAGPGTTADLQRHFAGELGRQGWILEQQVSTEALWTSIWRRVTEAQRQTGTLLLVQVGQEVWKGSFGVLQPPAGHEDLDWASFLT